jgi:hypothetical protein
MTNTNILQLTAPQAQGATLQSSAMLCELGFSVWTARKLDKRASDEVTAANHAETGMANVNKRLLACDELTAIQKFAANARSSHYAMTLPWSDSGLRLLPTSKYFDYNKSMTALRDEFFNLVDKFLARYEWLINETQLKLGDMYDPNEYPSLDKVRAKFGCRINYIPLPESGDFRVDIGTQGASELQSQYEAFYSAQLERAMSDIWSRAYEVLSRMSERLDYADGDQKKVFRDTLVSNVIDLVDMMETMNITGDPNMQLQQRRLKNALQGITPEALREDGYLRRETKRAVDEAIKALPSLDM